MYKGYELKGFVIKVNTELDIWEIIYLMKNNENSLNERS